MVQSTAKPAVTESERRTGSLGPDQVDPPPGENARGGDMPDEIAFHGVIAIHVPREVIAGFSGTIVLNEVPERQPEVVLAPAGGSWEDDDE
jgi:hypothetical protein